MNISQSLLALFLFAPTEKQTVLFRKAVSFRSDPSVSRTCEVK